MKKIVVLLFFIFSSLLFGIEELPKDIKFNTEEYVLRLTNGDIITGRFVEEIESEENGKGVKFQTNFGIAPIYLFEIEEIRSNARYNRHHHRHFIMPTAEAIKDDYFVGFFQLAFLYGGAGITDYFSITAGRSFVPYIGNDNQVSVLNFKATFLDKRFENEDGVYKGSLLMAAGANLAWVNDANRFRHYYFNSTFKGETSKLTLNLFYKNTGQDLYTFRFGELGSFDGNYNDGSIGVGLGLEDQFWNWRGVNVMFELWNPDFSRPSNTGVLLGFRLFNSKYSADFGLVFFTVPFAAPFVNFVFTPF